MRGFFSCSFMLSVLLLLYGFNCSISSFLYFSSLSSPFFAKELSNIGPIYLQNYLPLSFVGLSSL